MKLFFLLLISIACLNVQISRGQTGPGYKMPDSFRFDYTVTQSFFHAGKTADSSVVHFFYTKSGEYAGAEVGKSTAMKGNLFIILTKEGYTIIFDEHHKSITIISIRKLGSDLGSLLKWIRMDSVMANMRKKTDGREWTSTKTGNRQTLGNYNADEYSISDSRRHHGLVWIAKMDFDTQGDYLMSAIGANWLKMAAGNTGAHPLLQALMQPKTLVTDIEMKDSSGNPKLEMKTEQINLVPTVVPVTGYSINDYSNMTFPEIFQAEMKKRNH